MNFDKQFFKSIIKFAIPVLFDQGFVALLLTMNTVMCGGSGTAAVSAIGMVDSVHMLVAQFFVALAAGGTVVVAQAMGRDDVNQASKAAKQGIITGVMLAAGVSLVIFIFRVQILNMLFGQVSPDVMREANNYYYISIFSYPFQFFTFQGFGVLRGSGNSKTPMVINLTITAINLIVGLFLIMGVKLGGVMLGGYGTFGAGVTFLFSRIVGCVLVFIAVTSRNSPVKINFFEKFKFDFKIIKEIYNVGIPASTESLLFMLGRLICQIFITTMGTNAIAINSIANSLATIHSIPGNSMGIVATTLVGRQIGAKSQEGAKKTLIYCILISYAFVIIFLIPFFFFADNLAGLYSSVPEIVIGTGFILKNYAAAALLWPIAFIMPSGFRGASDAFYPLFSGITIMWALRVVLGYYLGVVMGLGVIGIWIGMYADWFARTIIYTRRYKNGKWLKKLNQKIQEK